MILRIVMLLLIAQLAMAPATGRLSGRIVNSDTGAPLIDAQVDVQSQATGIWWRARTDSDGGYDIDALPAGLYTVWAAAPGFASGAFGLRRSRGVQGAVPVTRNGRAEHVDVALTVEATLSGRLTTAGGAPLAGVAVTARRPHLTDGQRILQAHGNALTDADGRYRIAGLPHGDYYVTAATPSPTDDAQGGRLAPTFCPGTSDQAEATRVRVLKGSHVDAVDFPIVTSRWSQVSGRVRSGSDAPLHHAAIIMQARDPEQLSPGSESQPRWLANGRFVFDAVPPGEYVIRTLGAVGIDAPMLFAAGDVTVSGHDVEDMALTMIEGASLSGRVRFESHGTPAPDVTQIRLFVPLVDGTRFGGEPVGRIRTNGVFLVTGVDAGRRMIRASGVPAPWMLSRVTRNGRDITDEPFDVVPLGRLSDVVLTFTDLAPSLSGTVRYASDASAVDMLVVAFSTDRSRWRPLSRHIAATRTDHEGHYRLGPLPAGPYLLVALQDYDETDINERDTLDQIARLAVEVTLLVGQTRAQDLRALPDPARGVPVVSSRAGSR